MATINGPFLKAADIARLFRVSVDSIYAWARNGVFPPHVIVKVGSGIRFDEQALLKELRAGNLYKPPGGVDQVHNTTREFANA